MSIDLLCSVVYPLEDLPKRPLPDPLLLREHDLGIHFLGREGGVRNMNWNHYHSAHIINFRRY